MIRTDRRSPFTTLALIVCLSGCGTLIGLDDFTDATGLAGNEGPGGGGHGGDTASGSGGHGGDTASGSGGHGGDTASGGGGGGVGGTGGAGGVGGSGGSSASGGGGIGGSGGSGGSGGAGGVGGSGGSSASGSGGAGGSGGSPGPVCAGTCVPKVPSGWVGPVAFASWTPGDAAPDCPANYPTTYNGRTYFGQVTEGNLNRNCSCGMAEDIVCGNDNVTITKQQNVTCGGAASGTSPLVLKPNTPVSPVPFTGSVKVTNYPPPTNSGSCPPYAARTPTYAASGRTEKACVNSDSLTAAGCDGDSLCAPPTGGEFNQLCIYRGGDHECPAEYPEQHINYETVTDAREAGECKCTSPQSYCGTVDYTHKSGTITYVDASIEFGTCPEIKPGLPSTAVVYNKKPYGSCLAKQDPPSGALTLDGKRTFCCEAPPSP